MKNKIYPILLIIFFFTIFFIFYKGLKNTNIYIPKTDIKKKIPSYEAYLFDSDKLINSNEIFKENKFYLMNIWSSWCIPCREEHVFLVSLSKQKNLEIIGLNYKDNIENAKSFLNEFSSPYKLIISDPDGTIAIEWGAYGVPETFIIHNKKIIKKIIGPINDKLALEIISLIE